MKRFYLALLICLFSAAIQAQWSQLGMDIDGEDAWDRSGGSVSVSSDGLTVAIGAVYNAGNGGAGHVRVYKFISGVWTQQGADIDGEAANNWSGCSVSLSSDGSSVAIGAENNSGVNGVNSGHVRVYKLISGVWTQQGADIDGEASDDFSGISVSMSSDGLTLAVGAVENDGTAGTNSGHVRVYKLISGIWMQQGPDIDGEAAGDKSGAVSISSDGLTVAIGAVENDGTAGTNSGHVRVYKMIAGQWTQQGADIDGESGNSWSGFAISRMLDMSSDGLTVAIGADNNNGVNGVNSGHVRVYKFISGVWTQQGADIDGESGSDWSGYSVSISSDGLTIAIGAPRNDGLNGGNSGHVRVYKFISGVWTQEGADIDGEAADDFFGTSVSLSSDGSTVAIGADQNEGVNGTYSGHVRIYSVCGSLGTDTQTACDSFTWINGITYTTTTNTATDTLTNVNGCDSIVTLNLTINNNTGIDTLIACLFYTWIDGVTYTASNNTATYILTNVNGCDSTVTLNLTITNFLTNIDIQTACNSYTWIDGNTYTASNTTATDTLTSVNGCDSLVTLDLTINSVNDSVIQTGTLLTAVDPGANYQWLNCDSSYSIISGETSQMFNVLQNGNYAVEVINNGCIDTSVCMSVSTIGIPDNNFGNDLTVYPNPTNGKLIFIIANPDWVIESLGVFDSQGKEVYSDFNSSGVELELSVSPFSDGMYYYQLRTSGNRVQRGKIIVTK